MQAPTKRTRTRNALLAALQEMLLDPDVTALSVPQLVGRCGMAQGTFYNYFDSLGDAIDGVGMLVIAEHLRVLESVRVGAADEAELVTRSARQTLMLAAYRPDVGRLLFDSGLPADLLLLAAQRRDIGRLLSDSGLPADRFGGGLRAHLFEDLQSGVATGIFVVADFEAVCTVYAGAILGACLDIYRGRLSADAIPEVTRCLLGVLGVRKSKAENLVRQPQDFLQWRELPLSEIDEA